MAEVISPQLLKALTDITGEGQLAKQLRTLEHKYGMSFTQFDTQFQAGKIPQQHSYEVEQDYLEWEGLLCRQRRLQEIEDWLR
jgi:hypothetical protein